MKGKVVEHSHFPYLVHTHAFDPETHQLDYGQSHPNTHPRDDKHGARISHRAWHYIEKTGEHAHAFTHDHAAYHPNKRKHVHHEFDLRPEDKLPKVFVVVKTFHDATSFMGHATGRKIVGVYADENEAQRRVNNDVPPKGSWKTWRMSMSEAPFHPK